MNIALTRKRVGFVWIAFAVIFASLASYHISLLNTKTPKISVDARPMTQGRVVIMGADIDAPLKSFADKFNSYVSSNDESSSKSNLVSALGYGAAVLTSIVSAVLEFLPRAEGGPKEEKGHTGEPAESDGKRPRAPEDAAEADKEAGKA